MMRVLFFRKVLGKTSIFAIFLILSFIFTNNLFGQSYPLWGELKAGKHQVGFRSVWKFDHSRRYTLKDANNSSKKTIPRPLLINVWYPAKEQSSSKHMKYREYFDILTNDPKLKDLADLYRKHNLSTLAELTLSKSRDQFNEKEEKIFAEFLDSRTASIKDGSALSAKFPVVIYHQGFGASFEDNSVLCEYLASNGFIVIGSSYLKENGTSLGIDGKEGSVRDIAYLLNFANDLPHADTSKVAMVGHSGGAQASVIAKSKTHLAIDAVVSLDTTQDPFSLSDPRWNNFTIPVLKNKEQMKGTLLAFAEYSAYFELYDSLKNMNRIYISMPKVVNHDDYISQGISARRLKNKLKPNADNETKAVEKYYRQICEYIFAFLQRELKSKRQVKNYFKNNFSSGLMGFFA